VLVQILLTDLPIFGLLYMLFDIPVTDLLSNSTPHFIVSITALEVLEPLSRFAIPAGLSSPKDMKII
jgi:hypothetical protein